ncbi:hypothetical protein [Streptomyces sp. NPDC056492]|uniref:hypothetical protein n=1 Tax=unclassified Streptomyces TaxID=2593676 RepID=UPI0036CED155
MQAKIRCKALAGVAVAALTVPLAAGAANASPMEAEAANCATAPVSDRAKPVVDFACDVALGKVYFGTPYEAQPDKREQAANFFVFRAWEKAGVNLGGNAHLSSRAFFTWIKKTGVVKNGNTATPGDIVWDGRDGVGIYLGNNKIAGLAPGSDRFKFTIKYSPMLEVVEPA